MSQSCKNSEEKATNTLCEKSSKDDVTNVERCGRVEKEPFQQR
jgi:hypothetical protein